MKTTKVPTAKRYACLTLYFITSDLVGIFHKGFETLCSEPLNSPLLLFMGLLI